MRRIIFGAMLINLLVGSVCSAAPVITDWSSGGGTAQNKDNAKDQMYLIKQGDDLTFQVTVDSPVDYEWSINKSTALTVNSNIFNWKAPAEKGIWEIVLRGRDSNNEEVYKEWAVSTLANDEAPDVFDCFSDGLYRLRTVKDPWERALPEWTVESGSFEAVDGYLRPKSLKTYHANLSVGTKITKGTWVFRYRYLN